MSLYKKSQEILYQNFVTETLGLRKGQLGKKLQKTSWENLIESSEKAQAYHRYVTPCLTDERLGTEGRASERGRIIERKLRLFREHIATNSFYFYELRLRSRKIKLLYGYHKGNKVKQPKYSKSLVISDALYKVITQKNPTSKKMKPAMIAGLKQVGEGAAPTERCFFHILYKGGLPRALIVIDLKEQLLSDHYIEKPLSQLLNYAFLPDLNALTSGRYREGHYDGSSELYEPVPMPSDSESAPAESRTSISEKHGMHLSDWAQFLRAGIMSIMEPVEQADYAQGIDRLMDVFRLRLVVIFDRIEQKFDDEEEEESSSSSDKENFNLSEAFNLASSEEVSEASDAFLDEVNIEERPLPSTETEDVDLKSDTTSSDMGGGIRVAHEESFFCMQSIYGLENAKKTSVLAGERETLYNNEDLSEAEKKLILIKVLGEDMDLFLSDRETFWIDLSVDCRALIAMDTADMTALEDTEMGRVPLSDAYFFKAFITSMLHYFHFRARPRQASSS